MSDDRRKDELGRRLIEVALDTVIGILEERPAMADRFVRALRLSPVANGAPAPTNAVMTPAEYARHARVCERTVGYYVSEGMTEGVHFHREGRMGRRIFIHVAEADAWRASRSREVAAPKNEPKNDEELVVDEIARRRAQVALKKTGVRR